MSQENVEIVRAAFEAYFRGDTESMLRLMDPEIVVMQLSEVPGGTTLHGHAGVMGAIAAWAEQWGNDYQLEIVPIVDAGNHVVVRSHQRGRGKGGVEMEDEIWFVAGFRNGRIAEWRMFGAEREALEAAGLSE